MLASLIIAARSRFGLVQWCVELILAMYAAVLCWSGVSWAFQPGLILMMDELGNLTRFLDAPYWRLITLFPQSFYNDRPVGLAFERLLFDGFGFNYAAQLSCYLVIHFTNCGLGFLLFRRLGVGVPLSLAAAGVFGSMWTTAATATYLGAVFDMLALFFLLGSFLALLSERRGSVYFSAVLLVLALRSKEFAIVAPVLCVILAAFSSSRPTPRETLISVARRTWIHFLIGIVFAAIYARLRGDYGSSNLYSLQVDARTILASLSYYTALIFGNEETVSPFATAILAAGSMAIGAYAVMRRRLAMLFCLAAYVLTLLPVSMLPKMRAPIYAYAPQMFLFLLIALLLEDLLAALSKRETIRWAAAAGIAVIVMSWAVDFQQSPYFQNRIHYTLTARRATTKSAADVTVLLPQINPGARIYVNHGLNAPWLFMPGPCDFLKLTMRQRAIECVIHQPEEKLLALYRSATGEKYLLNYQPDGSLALIEKSEK